MELTLLKAQINPHFLFNTLNSIYSLALVKSNKTADSIVKLSEIMRYIFRESGGDRVSIDREVRYIENYLSLQQQRFGNTIKLSFDLPEEDIQPVHKIEPLILMSFIENAFKHGVNPREDSDIYIKIHLEQRLEVFMKMISLNPLKLSSYRENRGNRITCHF